MQKRQVNGRAQRESPRPRESREDGDTKRLASGLSGAAVKHTSQRKVVLADHDKAEVEGLQAPAKRKYSLLRKNTFDRRSMIGKLRKSRFANRAEKNAYNDLEVVSFYDWDQKSEFKSRALQNQQQPDIKIEVDESQRHQDVSSSFSSSSLQDSIATPRQSNKGESLPPPSLFKEAKLGQIKMTQAHMAHSSLAPACAGGQLKVLEDGPGFQRSNTRVSAKEKTAKRSRPKESRKSSKLNEHDSGKLELTQRGSVKSDNMPGQGKSGIGGRTYAGLLNLGSAILGKQDARPGRDEDEARSVAATDHAVAKPKIVVSSRPGNPS